MSGVDDTYTKSLLHCNGTDGSTTITDESGRTWTAYGNAQIDTAQSKFGGASMLLDGVGDYIKTTDYSDFNVGKENFTIDFWMRMPTGFTNSIFKTSYASGTVMMIYHDNTNPWRFTYRDSLGAIYDIYASGAIPLDSSFHHIAVVRMEGTIFLFQDGTQVASDNTVGSKTFYNATYAVIGNESSGGYSNWVDEFRFSKGIARWNGAFTPPTSAYDYVTPSTEFIQKVNMF